jgi:hypothetical protein
MYTRKLIPLLLAVALPLAVHAAPYHRLTTIEMAVEMPSLDVRLDDQSEAQLYARPCDHCADVELHIDASTQLLHRGQTLPLTALNDTPAQGATLFYLPESGHVTRIMLWY